VSQTAEAQQLAAFLRMFKHRMDRSYEALAKRTGVSSSTLHRYCTGTSVPADYGAVQRFARECGATPPELRELHRRWALADAARKEDSAETPPRPRPARSLLAVGTAALVIVVGVAWRFLSRGAS
jgi:transcriptional regulator with XRE-family HTH domain